MVDPPEEPRPPRLRKLLIVNVLLVSGLGSLLAFFLSGGLTALRVVLLIPRLAKDDVTVATEARPRFRGAADEIDRLGTRAIPALLPHARAEVESDDAITYRVLVLHMAEGESWTLPPEVLDLAADCLASRHRFVRAQAFVLFQSTRAPEGFEALLAYAERLSVRESDRLELLATLRLLSTLAHSFDGLERSDLEITPATLRRWLEANRSHLPRQAGSR